MIRYILAILIIILFTECKENKGHREIRLVIIDDPCFNYPLEGVDTIRLPSERYSIESNAKGSLFVVKFDDFYIGQEFYNDFFLMWCTSKYAFKKGPVFKNAKDASEHAYKHYKVWIEENQR